MSEDAELLSRYAMDHSESAFSELIQRHVDLVYSAALRLLGGDTHRAEDVAQQVFSEVARQARRLARHPALTGWLYTTTRLMALRIIRTEQRRKARETAATAMNQLLNQPNPEPDWDKLGPVLDDAMHELNENDRLAVLHRFFKNKSLQEVGLALGLSENAARMRVDRALDKLRLQLARKGVTSTSAALGLALAGNAVTAAPSSLVSLLAATPLAATTAGGASVPILKLILMAKVKTGIFATAMILGVAAPLVVQHRSQVRLREENQTLRQELDQFAQVAAENARLSNLLVQARSTPAPRLPVPPIRATVSTPEPEDLPTTNLIARLLKDRTVPKLTKQQAESYLRDNRRDAASLLAAFRTSGDPALLQEAMQRFPTDAEVAFAALSKKDSSPQDRRQWLEAFKQAAPENALGNYLSALDYFKGGQPDQAVKELSAAMNKPQFQDYSAEFVQNDEEAYRNAGYSVAESKAIASFGLPLPFLPEVKQLSREMVNLSKAYQQAGDDASARIALQMTLQLGQRLDGSPGKPLVTELVGLAIQNASFSAMDPNAPYGEAGLTVKDQLAKLASERAGIQQLAKQLDGFQTHVADQDWISYKDRWRVFGEEAALRWLANKYSQ